MVRPGKSLTYNFIKCTFQKRHRMVLTHLVDFHYSVDRKRGGGSLLKRILLNAFRSKNSSQTDFLKSDNQVLAEESPKS